MDKTELLHAMKLPPKEAVDYMEQKELRITERWHDLDSEIRARGGMGAESEQIPPGSGGAISKSDRKMNDAFQSVIVGDEEFKRAMDGVVVFSRRPKLAMRDMAAALEEITEENFSAQGNPEWKALSEVTIRARLGGGKAYTKKGNLRKPAQRAKEQMKILQNRGLLAASVHSKYGDNYTMIGAGGGDPGQYARIHQLGGQAGRGLSVTLPARPYLPFSPDLKLQPKAKKDLLKIGTEHLRQAANV